MSSQKGLSGAMSKLSVTSEFPVRPAFGTQGTKVTLFANYFEIVPKKTDITLHRYDVIIADKEKPANSPKGKKLKRVFEILLEDSRLAGAVTDFKSMFFLTSNIGSISGLEVAYRGDKEDDALDRAVIYKVEIKHIQDYPVGPLLDWLKSTDPAHAYGTQLETIQALNVLMGHYPQSKSDATSVGGQKHYPFVKPVVSFSLGEGLIALRGYFKSVRLGTDRILLNVNVSHAVFLPGIPLVELFKGTATHRQDPFALERLVKKVRIETTHLPVKKNKAGEVIPKVKTIFGLATTNDGQGTPNPPRVSKYGAGPKDVSFFLEEQPGKDPKAAKSAKGTKASSGSGGKYISVLEFFKQRKLTAFLANQTKLMKDQATLRSRWTQAFPS